MVLSACTTSESQTVTSICDHTKHQEICAKVEIDGQVDLIVNLSSELTDIDQRSQLIDILESLGFKITSQLETLPVVGVIAYPDNWYLLSEIEGIESFSLSGTVDTFSDNASGSL